jgi:lipopolysaccharide/colanic/teichoic acid biosynthesis glycosyltransferase
VIKLRSMRTDAEVDGAQWAQKDDPRVTRIGRFIRKVRIDELPQTWTVLKGEMSFVGPRPNGRNSSPTWKTSCAIMPSGTW